MRLRVFMYSDQRPCDLAYNPEFLPTLKSNDSTFWIFELYSGGGIYLRPRDVQMILILTDEQIKTSIKDSFWFDVCESELHESYKKEKEDDWRQ